VKFTSASGLTHHLERGACSSAPYLNREKILQLVRRQDPHGLITNKQIEWHKEESFEYQVTREAYNGDAWECYICHREFRLASDLTRHLNSSAHKQQVYHCPNFQCEKQFVTLAALFNHLESEKCQFMKFARVQQQVHDIVTGQKRIAF
jgi:Zinc finger, C2H2 type